MTLLSSKPLESQWVGSNHMTQSIEEQIGTLATVKTELHFIQVCGKVLRAYPVPRPDDAALQQGECRLYGICVNVGAKSDVFLSAMIDSFMPDASDCFSIRWEFVGDDNVHVLGDIFLNVPRQRASLRVFGVEETYFAAALADADNNRFISGGPSTANATLLAAHVGFVHLDSSVQHWGVKFHHCTTDAMTEIPCGFVADSQHPLNLVGRHSLARLTDQVGSYKPFEQGEMGVMEDGASGNTELIVTLFAVQELGGQPC